MSRRMTVCAITLTLGLLVGVVPFTQSILLVSTPSAYAQSPVSFTRKTVLTPGTPGASAFLKPTTLTFGPDGKLYVGQQDGLIHALALDANYNVTSVNVYHTIYNTPNFNDDGSPAPGVAGRMLLGIAFDPSSPPSVPVMYVTHSDPRIGFNNDLFALEIDTDSGMVSKLIGPDYDAVGHRVDVIKGLPRSRENHATNALDWGPDGWLYIAQAGNTNFGAPSVFFSMLPEYYLSASLLRANVNSPTFTVPLVVSDVNTAGDMEPLKGQFEIYATGFRNAYDFLWHPNGKVYLNNNGGNEGLGATPGPADGCPGAQAVAVGTLGDVLNLVTPGMYGGHPNPARDECVYFDGSVYSPPLAPLPNYVPYIDYYPNGNSTNGIAVYSSTGIYSETMNGNLLSATWGGDQTVRRLVLAPDGNSVTSQSSLGTFSQPLDVTVEQNGNGAIFVAEHGGDAISVLVPQSAICPPQLSPGDPNYLTQDSDNDNYSDVDEIDNNTDRCSPSSVPSDFNMNFRSDLNDPDDDHDGVSDDLDPFFFDWSDGRNTVLPLLWGWNPGDQPLGRVKNTGFTGLQQSTNGAPWGLNPPHYGPTTLITGLLPQNISVGAAGGFMSMVATAGTSEGSANSQDNALQIGFDGTKPFRVKTRVSQPFIGDTPAGKQAAGLFVGLDQDNYVKLVVTADNGHGMPGLQFAVETGGSFVADPTGANPALSMPGPQNIDLFLEGDPSDGSLSAYYQVDSTDPAAARFLGTVKAQDYPALSGFFKHGLPAGLLTTKDGAGGQQMAFAFDFFVIEHMNLVSTAIAGLPINTGATTPVAAGGQLWNVDNYFQNGFIDYIPGSPPIADTTQSVLYWTERAGGDTITNPYSSKLYYSIPVPVSGITYTVRLHFAEIYWGAPARGPMNNPPGGERVFDVAFQGGPPSLTDYDINYLVGPMRALVESFEVPVDSGTLDIQFDASVDFGKIAAIEVLKVDTIANPGIQVATIPYSQTVSSGSPVTFTVLVTNSGDVTLKSVGVTDSQASPCSKAVGNLTAGAAYTYTCVIPSVTMSFTTTFTATGTPIFGAAPQVTSNVTVNAGLPPSVTLYLPLVFKSAIP